MIEPTGAESTCAELHSVDYMVTKVDRRRAIAASSQAQSDSNFDAGFARPYQRHYERQQAVQL